MVQLAILSMIYSFKCKKSFMMFRSCASSPILPTALCSDSSLDVSVPAPVRFDSRCTRHSARGLCAKRTEWSESIGAYCWESRRAESRIHNLRSWCWACRWCRLSFVCVGSCSWLWRRRGARSLEWTMSWAKSEVERYSCQHCQRHWVRSSEISLDHRIHTDGTRLEDSNWTFWSDSDTSPSKVHNWWSWHCRARWTWRYRVHDCHRLRRSTTRNSADPCVQCDEDLRPTRILHQDPIPSTLDTSFHWYTWSSSRFHNWNYRRWPVVRHTRYTLILKIHPSFFGERLEWTSRENHWCR